MGELMVDMVARTGTNEEIDGFDMKAGGAAANVAVAIARMDGAAGILAKVSGDFFGETLKRTMDENRVDTNGLIMDSQRKIGMAFITFDAERKPNYLFYRENTASASLCAADINPNLFEDERALYFSSMGLIGEPTRSATYQAAQYARQNGARVAFDPNIRFGLWPSGETAKQEILKMFAFVNICKMNDDELHFLFGEGEVEKKTKEVMQKYPGLEILAVTLGKDGAVLLNRNLDCVTVRPLDTEVVDTVGAGDSFFAALLVRAMLYDFQLDSPERLNETLEYANAAALLTAKRVGAIPAMPCMDEVEEIRAMYRRA